MSTELPAGQAASRMRLPAALAAAAFLAVMLVAGLFRFSGLTWGEGVIIHPDEYFVSDVTSRLGQAVSPDDYFDTLHSRLNPNNVGADMYVYGTFPVILTHLLGQSQGTVDLAGLLILGRSLSALADWLVVAIVFLIGWRTAGPWAGLMAAFFYAVSALPIQQAHFYTVDTFANLFMTAAILFALRVVDSRRPWLDTAAFGLLLGLAAACKITSIAAAAILILAVAIRWFRDPVKTGSGRQPLAVSAGLLVLAGALTVASFRVFQPYAFMPAQSLGAAAGAQTPGVFDRLLSPIGLRPNPGWMTQMNTAGYMGSGAWDAPPNYQWVGRVHWLFPLWNSLAFGLGIPLGVIAWAAVIWATWVLIRDSFRPARLIIPLAWLLLIFGWQGAGWVMTMRYFLPIYPMLAVLAGWALIRLWDRARDKARPARLAALAAVAFAALGGLLWGIAVEGIYLRPITRIAASHWIYENVPSDITVALQTPGGERRFQLGLDHNWTPADQPFDQVSYTRIFSDTPGAFKVEFPFGGTLAGLTFNHIASPSPGMRALTFSLVDVTDQAHPQSTVTLHGDFFAGGSLYGGAYQATPSPIEIRPDHVYLLRLTVDAGDPLVFSGAAMAHEGDWDWSVPFAMAPYDTWGTQYEGYQTQIVYDETPETRDHLEYVLDAADYLTISSNRFYASLNRNPQRFPLAIVYYRALFDGSLGFALDAEFTSRPQIGPLEFCDDFAEEAWTVYDHPRVFIFRKTSAYDPQRVRAILSKVDMAKIQSISSQDVRVPPAGIEPPGACSFVRWR